MGERQSLILVEVSLWKFVNHPLSAVNGIVLIGGAPRHLWWHSMSNGAVPIVICCAWVIVDAVDACLAWFVPPGNLQVLAWCVGTSTM